MTLPSDLISQFAKLTVGTAPQSKESIVYGTITVYDGEKYVKFDGSDLLTPVSFTTNVEDGERVTVTIKNHSAIVTGNISSPSARTEEVEHVGKNVELIGDKISEFDTILADVVTTEDLAAETARINTLVTDNATIRGLLDAQNATIDQLEADTLTVKESLDAAEANIADLVTENAEITGKLEAADADIGSLQTDNAVIRNQLTAAEADIEDIKADNLVVQETLVAAEAAIEELEAKTIKAEDIEGKYANIDFSNIGKAAMEYLYTQSGLIDNVVIGDGTITGELVGVTITGDLIKGNTVVADKLVIKGDNGLYYKLNTDGISLEGEQTDYNSLNGSIIRAHSITATQIDVKDLVAFDATIGGFKITDNSIYSGVKESVDNTTKGIYFDSSGQVAIGDATNFIKFYEGSDGISKLVIAADQLSFGASNTDVETAVNEVSEVASDAKITAGNNLVRINDAFLNIDTINSTLSTLITGQNGETLMTQTDTGWTFNISDMQTLLNSVSNDVGVLNNDMDNTTAQIERMNQSLEDLGEYTDYIKFGVDNGKPCIILGETDSVFKVVITNTNIRFMEGSVVPASISNHALNIEKAVVNGELQQGDFVWTVRPNGHYSLLWKG